MSRATCFKCSCPIRYEQKTRYYGIAYNPDGTPHSCNAVYMNGGATPSNQRSERR